MFWRLFMAYGIVLAAALAGLGWLLIGRVENHLFQEIQQELSAKTVLIRELAATESEGNLQGLVGRIAKNTGARVTFIAANGAVLADSDEVPSKMENHGDRPEIRQAETSEVGVSTRFSGTVHQPMMYVARRSDSGPARYVRVALSLDAVAAEVRWLRRVVWTATGGTLLVALLVTFVIARRMTAPLVELSQAANAIARGEFGKRVLVSSADEVGTLASSFNAMSAACAEQIAQIDQDREQLRAIFRGMVEGVVVLDAEQTILFVNDAAKGLLGVPALAMEGQKIWRIFRHRQLHEAVEVILVSETPYRCELEWPGPERRAFALHGSCLAGASNRGAVLVFHDITHLRKLETVRQDFVANVSHELKTPLAVIQATAETLLDGALADPEHNTRFLERIRENSERLHRLVLDLLTLGRIESNQAPLELEAIDLQTAVEACVDSHEGRAKAKELQLLTEPATETLWALADEEALAEILDNLVDNAIKYTPSGGTITLRWHRQDGQAVIEVADTGVGIPQKDLPRVFERFYRVDKARSRELGGTGLGLSIVKHLIQALGGNITATSEVGRGSVFTVKVPLAHGHAAR